MSAARCAFVCAVAMWVAGIVAPARAQRHAALEHEGEERAEQPTAEPHDDVEPSPASGHVPPVAPQHAMGPMTPAQMVDVMGMDDDALFSMLLLDRVERVYTDDGTATSWNASGWLGRDFDKLWLKSEGSASHGRVEHADVQAFWSHAIAPFWDWQVGARHDFGDGPDRQWAAVGLQGLAPYWFEVEATAYVGRDGRFAFRFESEYDVRLTQKWLLQPRVELNAYGRADPARELGAGVSDAEFGLRLRYEIRREFAPYFGVEWQKRFGGSAQFARAAGASSFDARFVAGVRVVL